MVTDMPDYQAQSPSAGDNLLSRTGEGVAFHI
jgi:hypothetical protein